MRHSEQLGKKVEACLPCLTQTGFDSSFACSSATQGGTFTKESWRSCHSELAEESQKKRPFETSFANAGPIQEIKLRGFDFMHNQGFYN